MRPIVHLLVYARHRRAAIAVTSAAAFHQRPDPHWLGAFGMPGGAMSTDVIVVTDDTTRAEIEEAMRHIRTVLDQMPTRWTDRRAALHAKLDALLTDWQRTGDAPVR